MSAFTYLCGLAQRNGWRLRTRRDVGGFSFQALAERPGLAEPPVWRAGAPVAIALHRAGPDGAFVFARPETRVRP